MKLLGRETEVVDVPNSAAPAGSGDKNSVDTAASKRNQRDVAALRHPMLADQSANRASGRRVMERMEDVKVRKIFSQISQ